MIYQLTPEHAKLWLPVVRELREYYEGENNKFKGCVCPLCITEHEISRMLTPGRICDECEYCLWVIFEETICHNKFKGIGALRVCRDPDWCKQSISRLKRWERRLEEIIREEK